MLLQKRVLGQLSKPFPNHPKPIIRSTGAQHHEHQVGFAAAGGGPLDTQNSCKVISDRNPIVPETPEPVPAPTHHPTRALSCFVLLSLIGSPGYFLLLACIPCHISPKFKSVNLKCMMVALGAILLICWNRNEPH